MRKPRTVHNSCLRRAQWVAGALGVLFLYYLFASSPPPPPATLSPAAEADILNGESLAADCSDWEYVSMSPSRDVKLLTAQFFLPHNLSFVLVGPRTDVLGMPKN